MIDIVVMVDNILNHSLKICMSVYYTGCRHPRKFDFNFLWVIEHLNIAIINNLLLQIWKLF